MERLAEAIILPAGPGDAAALAAVHVTAWRAAYQGILPQRQLDAMSAPLHARRWRLQLTRARPDEVTLAAEGPAGLLGYCQGAARDAQSEVFTLYLLPAAQRRGLGRRLLAAAARVLRAREARSLSLWVLADNHRARGFYEHLGGRPGAERPVSGWGGGLTEVRYDWPDIGALTGGGQGRVEHSSP